jgi:nitrate/TMAO reductase-like tetraheme cytochrome c subunit
MKGCGGCHKIGIKTEAEIKQLRETTGGFGIASCDSCHTRHTFSEAEARQPQTCQTCHMGFDHAQWEMYSSSKHGVRYLLKQNKILPETTSAPSCQSCHIVKGNHENRTSWGFMALRMPLPDDPQWKQDRTTILQALGVLDPQGNVTPRYEAVKSIDLIRLSDNEWRLRRETMLKTCNQCHSGNFAQLELDKADAMIRDADRIMAAAIRIVAALYQDKIIDQPKNYAFAFPDLLTFHDAPTPVEQKLFLMFMEYRMRAFQGAFHNNPDYAFWYGWSALQRALVEIKTEAQNLRSNKSK